ncbi:carbamoyltransferase [Patescibacteria group bacterium]|nr:carbamoyltransferase [Patescibacteria group bacterium]
MIKDGLIYTAEEERWSGIKHNSLTKKDEFLFPYKSLKYCLQRAKISLDKVETVIGVSMHPGHKLGYNDKILSNYLPRSIKRKVKFISHHEAHILSGYYLSKFNSAVGLCIDGAGSVLGLNFNQRERVSGFYLNGDRIDRIYHLSQTYDGKEGKNGLKKIKHSLGNFYNNFAIRTVLPGDEPEGTMMAMAALNSGKKFYHEVKDLIKFENNGLIFINKGLGSKLPTEEINIGGIKWSPDNVHRIDFNARCALASAVQKVFEEAVLYIAVYLKKITGCDSIILSGGCALNSKLNGKILGLKEFKNVYIPPAPHDAGTALGAALYGWCSILKNKRPKLPYCPDWGPGLGEIDIKSIGDKGYLVKKFNNFRDLASEVAVLLTDKKIVFLAYGNMEFGPRALGHRSMLAHPGDISLRDRLNRMKKRAYFRPLSPSIIDNKFSDWFNGDADYYMNKTAYVKNSKKGVIKGAIHADSSARVQLVSKDNEGLYNILDKFYKITKIPILINTSLNLKGKPIARSLRDVFEIFKKLKPDALVLDNILVTKND